MDIFNVELCHFDLDLGSRLGVLTSLEYLTESIGLVLAYSMLIIFCLFRPRELLKGTGYIFFYQYPEKDPGEK